MSRSPLYSERSRECQGPDLDLRGWRARQRCAAARISAIRAFTRRFTKAADGSLSKGKRTVPFDVA
jgi:hypothetical protein